MNFLVDDLVCLVGDRTQEVLTVTSFEGSLVRCGVRLFYSSELEPKPIQEGDCVRDADNDNRYEAIRVDDSHINVTQSKGHTFLGRLKTDYRAVARGTAAPENEDVPSFRIGDLLQEKGDEEGDLFTVADLTDGGRTVILTGGLEMQHTALEPAPFQPGDWVRSVRTASRVFRDKVKDIVGDTVYFDGYNYPLSECRRVSSAWPCEEEAPTAPKERTLAKVLAEIRRTDAKLRELRARRKALQKEARSAFTKATKVVS